MDLASGEHVPLKAINDDEEQVRDLLLMEPEGAPERQGRRHLQEASGWRSRSGKLALISAAALVGTLALTVRGAPHHASQVSLGTSPSPHEASAGEFTALFAHNPSACSACAGECKCDWATATACAVIDTTCCWQCCCGGDGFGGTTHVAHFDCNAEVAKWEHAWSVKKKAYCCQETGTGCPAASEPTYDCNAGLANWRTGWSPGKMQWCCAKTGNGCPTTAAPAQPYDCSGNVEPQAMWSSPHKTWCCENGGHGCPGTTGTASGADSAVTFDCNDGFALWQAGWSQDKKTWCCANEGKACDEPYDCAVGQLVPTDDWPREKKQWCCAYQGRACGYDEAHSDDSHPYDDQATASPTQGQAITSPTRGTYKSEFECSLTPFQKPWSDQQREWCCEKEHVGCAQLRLSNQVVERFDAKMVLLGLAVAAIIAVMASGKCDAESSVDRKVNPAKGCLAVLVTAIVALVVWMVVFQ